MDALSLLAGVVFGAVAGALVAWQAAAGREREARVRAEAELAAARQTAVTLEGAQQRFTDAFKAAAADALHGNSQAFLTLAQQALGEKETAIQGVVKPLQDALKQYEEHLAGMESLRRREEGALDQQLKALALANDKLQRETGSLVAALRAPQVRGRWGELALRRAVELAGMQPHVDFDEQASVDTDGGRLRPDMIVHLPGGRQLVIDSKVSVDGYLTAVSAVTDAERQVALDAHARQLRNHVQLLAKKEYWDQFATAPDFVVMFVAVEPSVATAMAADPRLFEDALERRVIIATPSFLIALLLTVAHAWRQEQATQNAEEIRRLGKELYDRLAVLAGHLGRVGRHLGQTVESFNQAAGSMQSRVLPSAQRMKELGATGGRDLADVPPVSIAPRLLGDDLGPAPAGPPEPPAPPVELPVRRARLNMSPDDIYGDV